MAAITVFIAFMVVGRLLSGVHWITDIIGGALFSAAVVLIWCASIYTRKPLTCTPQKSICFS
jgi:undecaprenyl-diphosphatase